MVPQEKSTIFRGLGRYLLSPPTITWEGILTIEQHCVLPERVREFHFPAHIITLSCGLPYTIAWGKAGDPPCHATVPFGGLALVTEGARLGWRRDEQAEELVMALAPAFVMAVARSLARDGEIAFRNLVAFRDPAIVHMLLALRAVLEESWPGSRLYAESLATALTVHLLRYYAEQPVANGACKGGLPPARLRRVLDYIETHLGEDTSLCQLAALAQLSPYHFASLFKRSTGLPPHRYVLQQRLDRAKKLLADGHLSLVEISLALGYANQTHFSTMFRKLTGTTPGAYRVSYRQAFAVPPARFSQVSEFHAK